MEAAAVRLLSKSAFVRATGGSVEDDNDPGRTDLSAGGSDRPASAEPGGAPQAARRIGSFVALALIGLIVLLVLVGLVTDIF